MYIHSLQSLITSTSQKDIIVTPAKSYTHQNITILNKDTAVSKHSRKSRNIHRHTTEKAKI